MLASNITFQPPQGLGAQELPKDHPAQKLIKALPSPLPSGKEAESAVKQNNDPSSATATELPSACAKLDDQPTADTTKTPAIDPYDFDAAHPKLPKPRAQMVRKFFKSHGNGPAGERQSAATGSPRLDPSSKKTGPIRGRPRTRDNPAPAQRPRSPSIEKVKGKFCNIIYSIIFPKISIMYLEVTTDEKMKGARTVQCEYWFFYLTLILAFVNCRVLYSAS